MKIIREDKLCFSFPDEWEVIKYDDTDFYRHKIETLGIKLSAVDILCARPDGNHLILIEIKDFRGYSVENRKRLKSELAFEAIAKCMHTLAALYTATYRKNVLRHFAEHPIEPLGVHELLPQRTLELILFMEEDALPAAASKWAQQNQESKIGNMELKILRITTNTGIKSRVLNTSLLKARDGFNVTHIP